MDMVDAIIYLSIYPYCIAARNPTSMSPQSDRDYSRMILVNSSLDSCRVGPNNLANLFAISKKVEGWHSTDAEFCSNIRNFIHVEHIKAYLRVFSCKMDKLWGEEPRGTVPHGMAVDDD